MAHHGTGPFSAEMLLGATGAFPQGKLTKEDEGEIRIAVGQRDGKVILDFGKPIAWIGMDAEQAAQIAESLASHAAEIRLRKAHDTAR